MKTPDKYSQVILIWLHGFQIMGDSTRFITVSMTETHRFTIHLLKKINYRKFSHGSKAYLQIFKFNFKPHLPPASVKKKIDVVKHSPPALVFLNVDPRNKTSLS